MASNILITNTELYFLYRPLFGCQLRTNTKHLENSPWIWLSVDKLNVWLEQTWRYRKRFLFFVCFYLFLNARLRIHIMELNENKFKYVPKIYIKCMFPVMYALETYSIQCSIHVTPQTWSWRMSICKRHQASSLDLLLLPIIT